MTIRPVDRPVTACGETVELPARIRPVWVARVSRVDALRYGRQRPRDRELFL